MANVNHNQNTKGALCVKWGAVTGDFTEGVALKLNCEGYLGFLW